MTTKSSRLAEQKRIQWLLIAAALCVIACCAANLFLGEYRIPIAAVLHAATGHAQSSADKYIVVSVREPRILIALMTGFAFGISGAMLQSLLRNTLADPGVLGINDGAGLFVTLFLVYLPHAPAFLLVPAAFLGAVFAIACLLLLTSHIGFQPLSVILNGIGLSLLFYAATKIVKTIGDWQRVQSAIDWLQGNLTGVSWPQVWLLLPWFLVGVPAALLCGKLLDLHELGDEIAVGLGSRLHSERLAMMAIIAVLTGSAISITGPVYFVGFLSGNLARLLARTANRPTLLLSGLIGSALVLAADLLARLVIAPRELRMVFLISVVGGPVLALLLIVRNRWKALPA